MIHLEDNTAIDGIFWCNDGGPDGSRFHRVATGNYTAAFTTTLPENVWLHMVATYDGDRIRLYIDGAFVDDGPSNVPLMSFPTLDLTISWASLPFPGRIDEVAVYDYPLDPARITAHYNAR